MSLLDDIREEQHEHLLEKGNLLRKTLPRARWVDRGYIGQRLNLICPRCDKRTEADFTLFRETCNEVTGEIVRVSVPRHSLPSEKGALRWAFREESAICATCLIQWSLT